MSRQTSVILIGSRSTQSVIALRILRELGVHVPLIISGEEDPGQDDWRQSLARAAREQGFKDGESLLVLRDPHREEVLKKVKTLEPDLILSVQWRHLLRPALFELARLGAINLHNAPLPLLRGCDPFSWAIHDGLEQMGLTLHQINRGVDSGDIFLQRFWPIGAISTAWSLYLDSLREGEGLLREGLPGIIAGKGLPKSQESRYATYHPIGQFQFDELEADWMLPAATLSAALRSRIFPPFQLPFFWNRDKRIEILECQAASGLGEPGQILNLDPLRVAAARGALQINAIRYAGEERRGSAMVQAIGLSAGELLLAK
jgi:methionyl-tRNA formyltransferase